MNENRSRNTFALFGLIALLALGSCGWRPSTPPGLVVYSLPVVARQADKQWSFDICNVAADETTTNVSADFPPAVKAVMPAAVVSVSPAAITIQGKTCEPVTLSLSRLTAQGWFAVIVRGNEAPLAKIGIARMDRTSSAVKVVGPENSPADIVITKGEPAKLVVKNTGDAPAPIAWHLDARGLSGSGTARIPAMSEHRIDLPITRHSDWPSSLWPYFADGHLVLRLAGSDPATAVYHPVKIRFSYFGAAVSTLIVFVFLFVGGLASFLVHTGLPNVIKRIQFRDRLKAMGGHLKDISLHCDPKVHHILRMERKKLSSQLEAFYWFGTRLENDLQRLEQPLIELESRVAIAYSATNLLSSLDPYAGFGLGPVATEEVRRLCEQALKTVCLPHVPPDKLSQAEDLVKQAGEIRACAGRNVPLIGETVKRRAQELQSHIQAVESAPKWHRFRRTFSNYDAYAAAIADPDGDANNRERAVLSLEVLYELYRCSHHGFPADWVEIVKKIGAGGWKNLHDARRRISVHHDKTRLDALRSALKAGTVSISIKPSTRTATAYDSISLTAWFENDEYNCLSAREDWYCLWNFDDREELRLGWTVWRFFPRKRKKDEVAITIKGLVIPGEEQGSEEFIDLKPVPRLTLPIIGPTGRYTKRTVAEIWRTALVQIVPLFGLIAARAGELEARDPLSASLILIAAGFATDSVKNAVTTTVPDVVRRLAKGSASAPNAPTNIPAGSALGKELLQSR